MTQSFPSLDGDTPVAGEQRDWVILWLINGGEGYGIRQATRSMARELSVRGNRVLFVSEQDGALAQTLQEDGFSVQFLTDAHNRPREQGRSFVWRTTRRIRHLIRCVRPLCEVIRQTLPDVIHVRNNDMMFLAGAAGRRTKTKVTWHLPNTINRFLPFNLQALSYQWFCKRHGVLPLGNSLHTAQSLGNRWVQTRVLTLGIDENHFHPSAPVDGIRLSDYGFSQELPTFAIVARVTPDKAQDRVVDAMVALDRPVQLLIAGGPPDSSYFRMLQDKILAHNAQDTIKLIGPVSDPRTVYKSVDVIINSRKDAEPFGLTIIEAMMMEKPVLAYRLGGPAETIEDNVTGWLIDESTPEAYLAGIQRALAAQEQWGEMGIAARKRAVEKFSIKATVSNYLRILLSLS